MSTLIVIQVVVGVEEGTHWGQFTHLRKIFHYTPYRYFQAVTEYFHLYMGGGLGRQDENPHK